MAQGAATPKQVSQAVRAQHAGAATKLTEFVKVDLERVDNLVSLIGELVIVESMVANAPELGRGISPRLRSHISQMSKITRDLQSIGMRMRMVPVRGVFQKMARMVRDLSRSTGKLIDVETSGEGTEMDRGMVEKIADPLVHMIRNAVDHGIESNEGRSAAGKPARGTIRLRAYHEGGSIVIEVADDGTRPRPRRDPRQGARQRADQRGRRAQRPRDLQPDLRPRLLHRQAGHRDLRPRRGHGRGAAQHRGGARAGRDRLGAGARLDLHACACR